MSEWQQTLRTVFRDKGDAIGRRYAVNSDADVLAQATRLNGDALFGRHAYFTALQHSRHGNRAYLYMFSRKPQSPRQSIGATHGAELPYVFGEFLPFWPRNDRDDELSEEIIGFWTRFARKGDPVGPKSATWPAFEADDPYEMNFGDDTRARTVSRHSLYELMLEDIERRAARAGKLRSG